MSAFRLLLITNRYPAHKDDSASPFVADFVSGLRRNRIDCTVLTPYHRAERYDDNENVIRFKWGEENRTIGSLPFLRPSSWTKIAAYIRQGYREAEKLHHTTNFDFCLALWAAPSGLFARRLNKKFGLPYAVWCLGSDIHTYAKFPVVGNMIQDTLTSSDAVYSDGHELGRMAEKLSGCRYQYMPSMRRVSQSNHREGKREQVFICPGRVEKSKGVFDLLEAFGSIAGRFDTWSLYFIGEGRARDKLQEKIDACRLRNRVKILGFLKSEEMFRLIDLSAGVIIPTHRDSLPLTFGEAMQLKRPVIATDVGDLKYFTEKYDVGLVVPPGAPGQLAEAMTQFITEKKEYGNGFEECVRELDIDLASDRFAEWLKGHLADRTVMREKVLC